MRSLACILYCMSVISSAWDARAKVLSSKERVQGSLHSLEKCSTHAGDLHLSAISALTAQPKSTNVVIQNSPEITYRLRAITFEGGKVFSPEQLADAFHVQAGGELSHAAIGHGLERLRQLYSANGYINFAAVPTLQVEEDRNTVVLTLSIDEGVPFNFGQLFLAGDEKWAGETNALRRAWASLSGKRYSGETLSKWLFENATFLPNDEKIREQFVEQHIDATTHTVDIQVTFP
jgi:outer membrane protein assembly factor BamA